MEKKEFKYEIDGKTYVQRPLVLGQMNQAMNLLKGITIPSDIDAVGVVSLLGDKLPDALAIMITEEGTRLKDKDMKALSSVLRESVDIETAIEIIDNFFGLNPIVSAFERLTGIMTKIMPLRGKKVTGSTGPSSSSPEEILQNATESSGDIPSENAGPGSKSREDGPSSEKQ